MLQVLMRFIFLQFFSIPICQRKKLDSDTSGFLDFGLAFDTFTRFACFV